MQITTIPPKEPPMPDLKEKEELRIEFEELAKLLSRPQLTVACMNYGELISKQEKRA
jgi:hypothetical protein